MNIDVKCIATDLDGTLLQNRGLISDRTRAALEAVIAKGIAYVPLSGRPYTALPSSIFDIDGIQYCSTSNGASIQEFKTGKRLNAMLLPAAASRKIVACLGNFFRSGDITYEAFIEGQAYAQTDYVARPTAYGIPADIDEYIRKERRPVPYIIDFIYDHAAELDGISLILKNPGMQGMLYRHLERNVEHIYATSAVDYRIEISNEDTGKANSLKKILEYLDIPLENVLAFGDGDNDADMLRLAGIGAALENATESCKAAADVVIGRYDAQAPAAYIEDHIL